MARQGRANVGLLGDETRTLGGLLGDDNATLSNDYGDLGMKQPWNKPTLRSIQWVDWKKLQKDRRPWSKPSFRRADSLMYVEDFPSDGKVRNKYEQTNPVANYRNPS